MDNVFLFYKIIYVNKDLCVGVIWKFDIIFLFIGLIYVVDSSDREWIFELCEELFGILDSDEMREVFVVVIVNK